MATIDRAFAEEMLKTFDDPQKHGVHILFNQWWKHAPDEVIAAYQADFEANPEQKAFAASRHFADPIKLETIAAMAEGTVGRTYHDFIVENGLEANLAMNYEAFHDHLASQGDLDRMPDDIRYAIIRGFQQHDMMHVLTGYPATPLGEIALQAFCLAQLKFPYFAMWVSVTTTRMTYLEPHSITPLMDAITDGWQLGRQAKSIQFERWEDRLEETLSDVQAEFGLGRTQAFATAAE